MTLTLDQIKARLDPFFERDYFNDIMASKDLDIDSKKNVLKVL